MTLVKCLKKKVFNSCDIYACFLTQSDEEEDVPMEGEYNFSDSYFYQTHICDVETIEESINKVNLIIDAMKKKQ